MIDTALIDYIESNILPLYDSFDAAHRRDHVECVISQSLELAEKCGVDPQLAYTIAAYHDTGLTVDRKTHHLVSGRIIRNDTHLKQWFTDVQIEIMAQAAEDHRASAAAEPRSIYGRIVAEADRFIHPDTVITRAIQYGIDHYPNIDREGQWQRMLEHIHAKYAHGGYLKLWFPDSPNARRLEELRTLISNESALRALFDRLFDSLT